MERKKTNSEDHSPDSLSLLIDIIFQNDLWDGETPQKREKELTSGWDDGVKSLLASRLRSNPRA